MSQKTLQLTYTCCFLYAFSSILFLIRFIMYRIVKNSKVCHLKVLPTLPLSKKQLWLAKIYKVLDIVAYASLWYSISISITMFNKWFLNNWQENGFPFPVTMSCIHMMIKFVLSRWIVCCSKLEFHRLLPRVYCTLAIPIGILTAFDISMSNLSFKYVSVSFYTIVKSGGNVWNLMFSLCLGLQQLSPKLVLAVILICCGIGLSSYGAVDYEVIGLVLVLGASIIGTLRWVLTQFLLKQMKDDHKYRTLSVIYEISPASALGLIPGVVYLEAGQYSRSIYFNDLALFASTLGIIIAGGLIAFLLIFVEIVLVKKTSALTLGITGNFKDLCQIAIAVLVFGDYLSPINVVGLFSAFCGMVLYTVQKNTAQRKESYQCVENEDVEIERKTEKDPAVEQL